MCHVQYYCSNVIRLSVLQYCSTYEHCDHVYSYSVCSYSMYVIYVCTLHRWSPTVRWLTTMIYQGATYYDHGHMRFGNIYSIGLIHTLKRYCIYCYTLHRCKCLRTISCNKCFDAHIKEVMLYNAMYNWSIHTISCNKWFDTHIKEVMYILLCTSYI